MMSRPEQYVFLRILQIVSHDRAEQRAASDSEDVPRSSNLLCAAPVSARETNHRDYPGRR